MLKAFTSALNCCNSLQRMGACYHRCVRASVYPACTCPSLPWSCPFDLIVWLMSLDDSLQWFLQNYKNLVSNTCGCYSKSLMMWFPTNHSNLTFYYLLLIPQVLRTQPSHQHFAYAMTLLECLLPSVLLQLFVRAAQLRLDLFSSRKLFLCRIFWPSHFDCHHFSCRSFDSECPQELQTRHQSRYSLSVSLPVSVSLCLSVFCKRKHNGRSVNQEN